MKTVKCIFVIIVLFSVFFSPSSSPCSQASDELERSRESVLSPNAINKITFSLRNGVPYYNVNHNNEPVILPSWLGFVFSDYTSLANEFEIGKVERESVDYTWTQPWGEVKEIRDNYNLMKITLKHSSGKFLDVYFRAYDDGIAFRYEIPEQEGFDKIEIADEVTEFKLAGDHEAWWIPAYAWNRYEYLFQKDKISNLDTLHTPLTIETKDGLYISIHEAALTDYSSMALANNGDNILECDLFPWSDGIKVKGELPLKTPWRTIQIAGSPGDLITSYLVLNCNEPNKMEDISWIQPGKYVGIWWGMHTEVYTWASGEKHGATTENTKRHIDFAANHGFDGVLVEGWNIGWDGDWIANADSFRFTQPYPDYDLLGIAEYTKEKGVKLIAHNETSGGILNYEQQMEDAFALYHDLGIDIIKSGYVQHRSGIKRRDPLFGEVLGNEWHHGQYMVEHYRKVVETAARYRIMLDVHEPVKDTGIRRTWPNMMTREGARGQEFNAWGPDGGNPPEHTTIVPFTRGLSGPFDFTPGIFDILLETGNQPNNRINTTLAKQLALYVVIYSPLHMAADLPENYEGKPEFQFIKDVPTDWLETIVLNGVIGDYITIARKDRKSEDWYLGSITDEKKRTFKFKLDFLDEGKSYRAEIYADAKNADVVTNPLATKITTQKVTGNSEITIVLAPGGGQAIRFVLLDE